MRQARQILGGALLGLLVTVTGALAKPAYVTSTVNLRSAPGTTSEIVGKIPGGSLVDAGECSEGWCAITWESKVGFAIQTSIDLSGRVPQKPARRAVRQSAYGPDYYDEPPIYYRVEPPPFYARPYYYGRPYYRGPWHHRW